MREGERHYVVSEKKGEVGWWYILHLSFLPIKVKNRNTQVKVGQSETYACETRELIRNMKKRSIYNEKGN